MSNNRLDIQYFILGILGSFIILYGYSQDSPQFFYILGSTALLLTALHFTLVYFLALELILIAGHTAIIMGIGPYTQVALPILLCFQLLIFYLIIGKESTIFLLTGIVGIALLSLGFSYNNQWVFFWGSLSISIYAYHSGYNGRYPSYIWAVLNTIFALLALYKLIF